MKEPKLEQEELEEALDNLRIDEVVFTGGSEHYRGEDGSSSLNAFLREQQIVCAPDSATYQKLRDLFRRAQLENTRRTMDRIEKGTIAVHDPLFSRCIRAYRTDQGTARVHQQRSAICCAASHKRNDRKPFCRNTDDVRDSRPHYA